MFSTQARRGQRADKQPDLWGDEVKWKARHFCAVWLCRLQAEMATCKAQRIRPGRPRVGSQGNASGRRITLVTRQVCDGGLWANTNSRQESNVRVQMPCIGVALFALAEKVGAILGHAGNLRVKRGRGQCACGAGGRRGLLAVQQSPGAPASAHAYKRGPHNPRHASICSSGPTATRT